jgi:glycosyltransferase involved in cell wall biosynthesis
MSKPKITIIIPVYNVEPYLRQCLDSVVNQTMREIQIICVNDGSPDNSLSILQEYADRDSRIEIIDKPNGGAASARNAAYPHIRGNYTLFIDSDDWIELDLCEKTFRKSEETGAEITVFFDRRNKGERMKRQVCSDDKTTPDEKLILVDLPSTCCKLWRTDFLLNNNLFFPEGLTTEDYFVCWKGITLADKVSVVSEQLYHYRVTPGSVSQTRSESLMHIVSIFNKIRESLLESGHYAIYRDKFILEKLRIWHYHYCGLPTLLKPRFAAMIRASLTADDHEFCRTTSKKRLRKTEQLFYKMIDGGPVEATKYHVSSAVQNAVKLPERLLRHWVIKPIKKRLKAA